MLSIIATIINILCNSIFYYTTELPSSEHGTAVKMFIITSDQKVKRQRNLRLQNQGPDHHLQEESQRHRQRRGEENGIETVERVRDFKSCSSIRWCARPSPVQIPAEKTGGRVASAFSLVNIFKISSRSWVTVEATSVRAPT